MELIKLRNVDNLPKLGKLLKKHVLLQRKEAHSQPSEWDIDVKVKEKDEISIEIDLKAGGFPDEARNDLIEALKNHLNTR